MLFKTFAAVNRLIRFRLERNNRLFAAVCADCREHFAVLVECALFSHAALLAALRFVLQTFFSIKFLFTCCKDEFCAAVLTG